MPAKDKYHDIVRTALENDGWLITHDPLKIMLGRRRGYIDLAAKKILAAEKGDEKIAVEIKSFLGPSGVDQFEDALGQFLLYKLALETQAPDHKLFLAIPVSFYTNFFDDSFFLNVLKRYQVDLIVFDDEQQLITQWIK